MQKRWIVGIGALASIAGLLYLLTMGQTRDERLPVVVAPDDQQDEVAELRRSVASLKRKVESPDVPRVVVEAEPVTPDDVVSDEHISEPEEPPRGEAELRFAFDQLPPDQRLAQEAKTRVEVALESDKMFRDAVRNIECRGSTCRLDIEMSSDTPPRDITKHLLGLEWEGSIAGGISEDYEPGGPVVGVAFLGEPGEMLAVP